MLEVTLDVYFNFCLLVYRLVLRPAIVSIITKMTNLGLTSSKSLQTIEFPINGGDLSAAVIAENVVLIPSPGDHKNGSSKVKLSNIVDYSWEEKFYNGQLLAVHMGGNYIAYSIKGCTYAVRVVNRDNGKRALIKGFAAMVEDLSFAFIPSQITLACVDETGSVYVHNIFEDSKDIAASLLLHIIQIEEVSAPRRVFWCPFIPEDTDDDPYSDETALLLAITRENKVEIWNVASAASGVGAGSRPVRADTSSGSCIQIVAHDSTIVAAAFSPDGTAIATASMDGECKFFQSESEPTCLHRWKPHGGKPVTSLFFLDDHKCRNPETKFWKYAVTGTDDNTELKLWTCETWEALQTIRFCPKSSKKYCKLKPSVDLSSGYIFISDMYRKMMYVLELDKGNEDTIPFVRTVTEFMFPCAILSYAIVDAAPQSVKAVPIFGVEDLTNGEDEDSLPAVRVKMYLVQPKSLQECHIVFQTNTAVTQNNTICYDKNGLDEVPNVVVDSALTQQAPLNLMTPDAFHSPHSADSAPVLSRNSSSPTGEAVPYPANLVITNGEPPSDTGGGDRRRGFTSSGSSPSREVEEILSSPRYFNNPESGIKPKTQSKNISSMMEKLRSLETNVLALQTEVQSLVHVINLQSSNIENLQEEVKKNRGTSLSEVEGAITNAVSTYKPVSEQDIVVAITPLITQAVLTVINPAVIKSMADLHNMVHGEVAAKLSSTDSILKDNISKLVKSKPFADMLVRSFSNSISTTMEPVFRESFTRTVIPMFESACSRMYSQMSEALSKGINDTIKAFDEQANVEVSGIQSAVEKITEASQQFSNNVEKESRGLEETVLDLERRLKACMNGAAVRSGTVTPAYPNLDPHVVQSQIAHLIKQGQYNTAFQQALSASDLNIVTYTCERVDVSKLFSRGGCVLQQHVLLSLIQQLAADMAYHVEIKLRYLEAAVMNLLPNNENTRDHMPQVLTDLQRQLLNYSATSADPGLANKSKLLAMACQQMVRNLKEDY